MFPGKVFFIEAEVMEELGTMNFGTDTSPSFSVFVPNGIPNIGIYNLNVKATLTGGQVLTATKEIFVTDYTMVANSGVPRFNITSYTTCCPYATFVEDVPQTINYTTTLPAGITFIKTKWYEYGGVTSLGGSGLNYLGTSTTPNGSFTFTVSEPGFGIGQNGMNNLLIPVAFFSNTVTNENYYLKVTSNPNENLPAVTNAQVVNSTNGNALVTLSTSSATPLNIGTQANVGNPPLGPNITIRATPGTITPGSVNFALTGPTDFQATNRCEVSPAPFSLFGDVSATSYTPWPTTYPIGQTPYTLIITPYVGSGCTGSAGAPLTTSFTVSNLDDVTAPVTPAGLNVFYRSGTMIKLSWTASTSTDETGYKLIRTGGGPTTDVTNVLTYNDSTPMPLGSSYQILAYDAAGNESLPSLPAVIPIPLSTQFAIGNQVRTTVAVTVKTAPDGTNQTPQQPSGTDAAIVGGPVYFQSVHYWQVTFTTPPTNGWVPQTAIIIAPLGGSAVPTVYETKKSFTPNEVAIIVNSSNPVSSQIANYYATARGIPTANIITVALGNTDMITDTTFSPIRTSILSQLPASVQTMVFAGEKPFIVRNNTTDTCQNSGMTCMSITAALAMGYASANTGGGTITSTSYFQSSSLTPRTTHNFIPTSLLAGKTLTEAQDYINQGIAADNTYPPSGKVYSVQTADAARSAARRTDMMSVMPTLFNTGEAVTANLQDNQGGTNNPWLPENYLNGMTNLLGYHTGSYLVFNIPSNTIRPGALADHVTSFGGYLLNTSTSNDQSNGQFTPVWMNDAPDNQMPIQEWLDEGFAMAAGTVQEPWCCGGAGGLVDKFSVVSELWKTYYTGGSAVQAFGTSIKRPGQTLLAGEPLANPWKTSQVTFSGNILTIKTTHIKPGEFWNLQKSTDGSNWTTVQSSLSSPGGKLGLKTITHPNAVTTECYRLINPAVTSTVKIPVTLGSTWTATNGITNPEVCVGAGGGNPPDTAPPTDPSSVVVSGTPTQTQIVLDWANSTGNPVGENVFYNVYRNSGGGTPIGSTPIVSGLSSSTFTNINLTPGTTYLYRVSSEDAGGYESNLVPALPGLSASTQSPPDTQAPNIVAGLSVSSVTSSSISLNWSDSTDNGGGSVATYKIYRSSTQTGTYTEIGTSTVSDYVNAGLSALTTYWYKVSACDNAAIPNCSAWTAMTPVSGMTTAQQVGQVMGINGGVGPNNTEDVTPGPNPYGKPDYFISCLGSDANTGTSINSPWATLDILNTTLLFNSTAAPDGTRIFFKRDCKFRGYTAPNWPNPPRPGIHVAISGSASQPIQYLAYGTGAAPIITGMEPVTGWTLHSPNIYKVNVGAGFNPKALISNGARQSLAKSPNTGWNFSDSVSANNSTGSVTDSTITSFATNALAGAELVIRTSPWSWHGELNIAGNSGNTLTYNNTGGFGAYVTFGDLYNTGLAGIWGWETDEWAFAVQNKLSLLDSAGEWYYDKVSGDLYFWAPGNQNPNNLTVEMSKADYGMYINWSGISFTNVKIKNLVFEDHNIAAIYTENAKKITLENTELRYSIQGIHNINVTNATGSSMASTFKNNYIHDIYNDGVWSDGVSRDVYEGNVIQDIGMDPKIGATKAGWDFFGVRSDGDYVVNRNKVANIGYIGIAAGGTGLIEENYIENALGTLGDGAGIAFDHTRAGFTIRKNIIKDMNAEMFGMPVIYQGYIPLGKGIYFGDQDIMDTVIDQNVIINSESDGLWMDHGAEYEGNQVTNNIIYGFTRSGIGAGDFSVYRDFPTCAPESNSPCFIPNFDDIVTGNKIYGLALNQNPVYQMYAYGNGTPNAHTNFGTWNNNYYYNPYRQEKAQVYYRVWGGAILDYLMPAWQVLSPAASHDVNSTASNYTLTDPNLAADIYYNATPTAISQPVGTGGCTATGGPMSATQTIQPFSAVVVEHRVGGC